MSLECTVKLDAWKHGGDPPTKGRSKYLVPCALGIRWHVGGLGFIFSELTSSRLDEYGSYVR